MGAPSPPGGGNFGGQPIAWTEPATTIETEFIGTPGLVRGECVQKNGYSYLEVTVHGGAGDARPRGWKITRRGRGWLLASGGQPYHEEQGWVGPTFERSTKEQLQPSATRRGLQ